MAHLDEVIRDVERYSIEDVIAAAEKSLEPCDCKDPDVIELKVIEQVAPVRTFCTLCGRDVA